MRKNKKKKKFKYKIYSWISKNSKRTGVLNHINYLNLSFLETLMQRKIKIKGKNNRKARRKEKLCVFCKYFTDRCSLGKKELMNQLNHCNYYKSANHRDDSDTLRGPFAEYKARLESKLNPIGQMQEMDSPRSPVKA
jgi:hypothetical protein